MTFEKLNCLFENAKSKQKAAIASGDTYGFWKYNGIATRILRWKLEKLK